MITVSSSVDSLRSNNVETVVNIGYAGLMAGKTVMIPGLYNKLAALTPRFLPRNFITRTVISPNAAVLCETLHVSAKLITLPRDK